MNGAVYLLHFDQPFHHARHYVGYVERVANLDARDDHHAAGRGSRLLAAVAAAGIGWERVRVWEGADRTYERRLKQRSATRLCPLCAPQSDRRWWNRAVDQPPPERPDRFTWTEHDVVLHHAEEVDSAPGLEQAAVGVSRTGRARCSTPSTKAVTNNQEKKP